ncbi:uncharacterized protein LOC103793425 [Callithrix jacchus]
MPIRSGPVSGPYGRELTPCQQPWEQAWKWLFQLSTQPRGRAPRSDVSLGILNLQAVTEKTQRQISSCTGSLGPHRGCKLCHAPCPTEPRAAAGTPNTTHTSTVKAQRKDEETGPVTSVPFYRERQTSSRSSSSGFPQSLNGLSRPQWQPYYEGF